MIVNEQIHAWDREILELGKQGFTHKTIKRMISKTYHKQFSIFQINYRLSAMGVSTLDYRNGRGGYAEQAHKRVRDRILRLRGMIRDVKAFEARAKQCR